MSSIFPKCAAVFVLMCIAPVLMAGEPKSRAQMGQAESNEARNEAGVIDEDAEIEGITIINGSVSIDGVKIPRGVRKFHSAKTGRSYRIDWGKGDNVSVTEQ